MKHATIFITYNPNIANEQTLAVRLHTIGAVNGFQMLLPDRYNSETILGEETRNRIGMADYVILFATTNKLSNVVKEEIEYAYQCLKDKSKIIVIYGAKKSLSEDITKHFTEIFYTKDETSDNVIERIFNTIFKKQQEELEWALKEAQLQKQKTEIARLKGEKERQSALIALLGIGLGLAILAAIAKE